MQILGEFPKDKKITVVAVMGDNEAFQFAHEILAFLKQNNFQTAGVDQVVYTSPAFGLQKKDNPDGSIEFIVGVNQ